MEIIETNEQFEDFLAHYTSKDKAFVDAVPTNQHLHPRRSGVSFVVVRSGEREALFPISHNDANEINPKKLLKLNTGVRKFAYDKKRVLHLVPFQNLVDCKLIFWFKHNRPPSFDFGSPPFEQKNIYRPIMRLAERSQNRIDRCEEILNRSGDLVEKRPFRKYNKTVTESLFRVERNGMYADSEAFSEIFGKDLTDSDGLSHSNYNVYTQTGRPSNAYKGVNYAALEQKEREVFESRFDGGKLLSVDYDAFHLRIVSSIMGYDAPEGSFHEHLAKLYFGEDIDEEDYKEAKKFTFQFIYNPRGIPDELLQLEFFQGVKDLTEKVWEAYKEYGVIQTGKYHRQISGSKIDNFNPAKAFNYLLQATETEIICGQMSRLLDYLSGKNSCIALYLYDSVLIDYDPSDEAEIEKIKSIMETGDLTVDLEMGDRFSNLEEIHIDEQNE